MSLAQKRMRLKNGGRGSFPEALSTDRGEDRLMRYQSGGRGKLSYAEAKVKSKL
jgi:hypothetical protein